MIIEEITVTAFQQHTRILGCEKTRLAICIDPGDEAERISNAVDRLSLQLQAIVLTHAHLDHIGAVKSLKKLRPEAKIILHKADEFILEPVLGDAKSGLARSLERRRWSGVVQVRLKHSSRVLYFECVLNAIVHDNQVVGASALARDVTEEREKEKRFAELFETLTANPAKAWKLNAGKLAPGKDADIVVAKNNRANFFSTTPADLLLVIHQGNIRLFDEELYDQLRDTDLGTFSKIYVGDSCKYVQGDLPGLIQQIKQYYTEADIPVDVQKRGVAA